MTSNYSLVLDVGTTGIKASIFDGKNSLVLKKYIKLNKSFPKKGWVEQDPKELLSKSIRVIKDVASESGIPLLSIGGLGITNQRETTILWDKRTGKPAYPAIVWEDTRTKDICSRLSRRNKAKVVEKTGLPIDTYFSATKIKWILENVSGAKKLLEKQRLLFGTVDSWIIWNITRDQNHLTDYTNASRTLLFNIKELSWSKELLDIFDIPKEILPEAIPSKSVFGILNNSILGIPLPIKAVCGDQQSAMVAAGIKRGSTKITFGTGTFPMQVIGGRPEIHKDFLTTIVPKGNGVLYAIESKIDCCGARVDEALDKNKSLKPIINSLIKKVAPMIKDLPIKPKEVVVDGGVTQSDYLIQSLSSTFDFPIIKQEIYDGTSLGISKLIND
ncbi:MAG: hypothetical protein COT88_00925 [Candidatus Colwellbacteria bacterium CG10_big_fil_rev_8_21_14_0_10_41_28]|uniref:ATP:glycerol 3-phosphotransferase n=1 Tax=Candidatus Colwellbacteria bacterium CG10_big_fil_rev_8_21_14_0_10_41_28 TaxID=1974539 RepID=A0A2H0VHL6_9BACT|nr:MAG: hypothetical protein COT88_00925 [Candidatus Colwellbacteria bacterium CG10_big_fil_rev_8_21_14_0_10_41_28]